MDTNNAMRDVRWVDNRLSLLSPDEGWQPNVPAGLMQLKEMRRKEMAIRKRWTLLAVAVGLACLSVVALPSPRVLAHRCLECSVAVWQSLAQPNPPQANLKPQGERKVAPDFELKDAEGRNVQLSAIKGRVVVLNFWATWCHGCQMEIPSFIEAEKKYSDRGVTIIGISMDDDGWKSVTPWIKEKHVNYPIVIGNNDVGHRYGLEGMPLTVLVDRQGRIANAHAGIVDRAALEQQIQRLLREDAKGTPN